MRHIYFGAAFRSAFLAITLILTLLLLTSGPNHSFVAQANANDVTQCLIPQPTSNCCGCGGGDFGIPHCPAGFSPYDDYCLPACPQDYIRYPGLPGLCVPPYRFGCEPGFEQVPLPQCPAGYYRDLRDADHCVPDIDYSTHLGACPLGMLWSYDHGRCEADCPLGTFRDGNGRCESNYSQECPKDFTRDPASGRCLPPGLWPPSDNYAWVCLPLCPQGTFRDIRHPTLCLPPPPTCEQGYENVSGRCLPICEKGAQRDPYGNCIFTCPQGSYLNLRGQCQQPECPQGTRRNDKGECLPPPPHLCDQGQETYNGQCVPICREGTSRDDNGRCAPDQPTCPQGQRLNPDTGQCDRIPPNTPNCNQRQIFSLALRKCVDLPPPVHCGQGRFKDQNGRCVDIPTKPSQPQLPDCPRGYRPDGAGGCMRVFVPRNCPQGTFFDRRSNSCVGLPDVPGNPPPRQLQPFNPNLLQLPPKSRGFPGINIQQQCPDGTYRDNNGRCVGQQ